MAVLKIDPPPETNDASELRAYINDLFEAINGAFYNIDEDNLSEEFLERLLGG